MKFYNLIPKLAISALSILFISHSLAQSTGVSPYSRFGLGEINNNHSPAYRGMGGASVALSSFNQINIENPASYAYMLENRPVFEADFSTQFLTLSSNGTKSNVNASTIDRFSLAFPVSKRLGIGLGFMPYARTGYDITATQTDPNIGTIDYLYTGSGGMNKAYLGFAGKLIDRDSTLFSIGADASFIFGGITKERRVEFPDDPAAYYTKSIETSRVTGFVFNTGLQFKQKLSKNTKLLLGATAGTGGKLNGYKNNLVATYDRDFISDRTLDTISYQNEVKGSYTIPLSYSFGAALEVNKNFTISTQVKGQNWSQYSTNFGSITDRDTLQNTMDYSLGIRFRPFDLFSQENMLQRTEYRAGVHYGNGAVNYNNSSLTNFGMSFGVGIPVTTSSSSIINYNSVTMLQLGVEYGQKRPTDASLLKENITTIYFGISIMPSKGDRWFKKRKIN